MQVKLHKTQYEVATNPHRFRVICAGRRWGKSVVARMCVLKWALEKPGTYFIVSPTYKQAKMIHWREFQNEVPRQIIEKKNEVELSITLKNGSIIELKGAENPDALRGIKLRGLVIDEIASIRNWDWLWSEVLRPTLTDYSAPALFISTPKGYNHFYDLFELGQTGEGDYKAWKYSSYDNPYIPKDEIDAAKRELTEDTFYQEYMADFRKATGLAHKNWNREIHIIEPFDVPREWQRGRGFDYGSSDPTASLRIAIDNEDNWFVERSYKNRAAEIEEHAKSVLSQDFGYGFIPIYGDPSGAQWEIEFRKYGVNIQSANKEVGQNSRGWVEYGVEVVNQRLKPIVGHTVHLPNSQTIYDAPKLFVLNTEENQSLIKEIELLRWKETSEGQTMPILDESIDKDGHSDLCACLRYFCVSYKTQTFDYSKLPQVVNKNKWRIR